LGSERWYSVQCLGGKALGKGWVAVGDWTSVLGGSSLKKGGVILRIAEIWSLGKLRIGGDTNETKKKERGGTCNIRTGLRKRKNKGKFRKLSGVRSGSDGSPKNVN